MLIRDAEIDFVRRVDMRIESGIITAIEPTLRPLPDEDVLDAQGHALLPGLHDHHLHLVALAAALDALHCGPPQVTNADALAAALCACAAACAKGEWIRGIGYHESVAGDIDRTWLDRIVSDHPVRIQQRSGRLWIFNSCALERLGIGDGEPLPAGMECVDGQKQGQGQGQANGRLFDADLWLRERLPRAFPSLQRVGALLAAYGVTGVTDTTPHNDLTQFRHFVAAHAAHELKQDILVMGDASLDTAPDTNGIWRGPTKFHLHEHALPPFDVMIEQIRRSHAVDRPVAVHCVTLTELVFALGALESAGGMPGDRIEHASVVPDDVLPLLVEHGVAAVTVAVVTQPNFILERGDAYLRDVDAVDQPWLYRLRGLQEAGLPLAGSTDAPFGDVNPWTAMQAAVDRRSRDGATLGAHEALTPEAALRLFLAPLRAPGGPPRHIAVGAAADLCLLDRPWAKARCDLAAVQVAATFKGGVRI